MVVDDPQESGTPARTDRRLNWGCSYTPPAGWINSDIKEGPGIDLPCDILEGLPLEPDSIDYAVSIHALPEIAMADVGRVLEELRRVLKPGGVLRLSLPSLEKGIAAYQAGKRDYFVVPDKDARRLGSKLVVQLLWYGYVRRRMCVSARERGRHRGTDPCWCHLVAFDEQHEINEVLHAAVRGSISWTRVRVNLLSPMLLDREGRNYDRGNACEAEPVVSNKLVQRLENLVAGTEIDMELHERAAVETYVNWESGAALRRLVEFERGFANDEREEVRKPDGRGDLKALSTTGCSVLR